MKKYKLVLTVILISFIHTAVFATNHVKASVTEDRQPADTVLSYSGLPTGKLYVYYPKVRPVQNGAALVLFFGGGWSTGSPKQFELQAEYLVKYGITIILADYRTKTNAGTTPKESLMDAKSAMRFIRKHAATMHLDPEKILAGGGSAGGQLAAASALCSNINSADDDLSISPVPKALILFNPAVDNGPGGVAYGKVKEYYKDFSPLHNIKQGVPPTIFFLGTKDEYIPVETANLFKGKMNEVGARCDLKLYPDQKHGFFNSEHKEHFEITMAETVTFLRSLGYIN